MHSGQLKFEQHHSLVKFVDPSGSSEGTQLQTQSLFLHPEPFRGRHCQPTLGGLVPASGLYATMQPHRPISGCHVGGAAALHFANVIRLETIIIYVRNAVCRTKSWMYLVNCE
jgi:hypothetical protein